MKCLRKQRKENKFILKFIILFISIFIDIFENKRIIHALEIIEKWKIHELLHIPLIFYI
jgi:hypothetical protein